MLAVRTMFCAVRCLPSWISVSAIAALWPAFGCGCTAGHDGATATQASRTATHSQPATDASAAPILPDEFFGSYTQRYPSVFGEYDRLTISRDATYVYVCNAQVGEAACRCGGRAEYAMGNVRLVPEWRAPRDFKTESIELRPVRWHGKRYLVKVEFYNSFVKEASWDDGPNPVYYFLHDGD
jgi:hypothetical protein